MNFWGSFDIAEEPLREDVGFDEDELLGLLDLLDVLESGDEGLTVRVDGATTVRVLRSVLDELLALVGEDFGGTFALRVMDGRGRDVVVRVDDDDDVASDTGRTFDEDDAVGRISEDTFALRVVEVTAELLDVPTAVVVVVEVGETRVPFTTGRTFDDCRTDDRLTVGSFAFRTATGGAVVEEVLAFGGKVALLYRGDLWPEILRLWEATRVALRVIDFL